MARLVQQPIVALPLVAMASGMATSWSAQTDRLARAYHAARRIGAEFHIAGIAQDYAGELPLASFDPDTMTPLFRYGEELARRGACWLPEPPGINWREAAE